MRSPIYGFVSHQKFEFFMLFKNLRCVLHLLKWARNNSKFLEIQCHIYGTSYLFCFILTKYQEKWCSAMIIIMTIYSHTIQWIIGKMTPTYNTMAICIGNEGKKHTKKRRFLTWLFVHLVIGSSSSYLLVHSIDQKNVLKKNIAVIERNRSK